MNKKRIVWLISALPVLMILRPPAASSQTNAAVSEATRYWGQTHPVDAPVVFAPGLANRPDRNGLKIVFSPDGRESLLGVWIKGIPSILQAKQDGDLWTKPATADFIVANQREKEPFFSPDGTSVFFVRFASICVTRRTSGSWSTPEVLGPPVNVKAEQYHPTVTLDGTLYFCSNRGGAYNIYRAKAERGRYATIEKVDAVINSHGPGSDGAYDPYIAPDESFLIFSSSRPGGYGREDQYISYRRDGHWTEPRNLGAKINTDGTEYGSYVSPDRRYYFFARRDQTGGSVLYWTRADFIEKFKPAGAEGFFTVPDAAFSHPKTHGRRRVGDTWSEPAIPAFADPRWNNPEPFFSGDGAKLYFISNRDAQPATNKKAIDR